MRLISQFQGLAGLARASYFELCSLRGVSDAKACQLMAALELGRQMVSLHPEDRAVINSPQDVANLLSAEMSLLEQEHLRVVHLDTKNHVTGVSEVYVGNVNSSVVRPAEVFRPSVRDNSVAIIVVHNHPSGDPHPQRRGRGHHPPAKGVGGDAGHRAAGHVVLAGQRHVSLKEQALGF